MYLGGDMGTSDPASVTYRLAGAYAAGAVVTGAIALGEGARGLGGGEPLGMAILAGGTAAAFIPATIDMIRYHRSLSPDERQRMRDAVHEYQVKAAQRREVKRAARKARFERIVHAGKTWARSGTEGVLAGIATKAGVAAGILYARGADRTFSSAHALAEVSLEAMVIGAAVGTAVAVGRQVWRRHTDTTAIDG